jgi:hypothetical protein
VRFVWTPIVLFISLSGVLAIFQNCTPAVPFGNIDFYSSLISSSTFPYEAGVDQLTYMSCSEQSDVGNDGTFFTFKVGAYRDFGLRVSQQYRDHVVKVDDQGVVFALQESQTSAGSRLQLAVRSMDNLQLMYVDQENGLDGAPGFDYFNFFPAMGSPMLSETLWYMEPGDYLRYYASARFVDEYRFEGRLEFMKSQLMENDLRSFLSNRGVLAVTFTSPSETNPLGPGSFLNLRPVGDGSTPPPAGAQKVQTANSSGDLTRNVFGAAIQPRFKQPLNQLGGSPGPDMPPRVLSSVQDITIDARLVNQVQRPWTCPDNMQFMIVLPQHAVYTDNMGNQITRCAMLPDPPNPSPDLRRIRQSLLSEDWFVDPVRRCAVPKADNVQPGSCYGKNSNNQSTHIINYDTFPTQGCGFGNSNGLCPHYASLCFRP